MSKILVVDDEENIRGTLNDILLDEGYDVITAADGEEAINLIDNERFNVILLDLWIPEVGGMEVLKHIKDIQPTAQTIIISGHGTIDSAVKATKMGAFDFLEKPLSTDRLLNSIKHALEINRLQNENLKLKETVSNNYYMVPGISNSFKEIEEIIKMCASTNSRVLITGENGTGKEVIARKIHELSDRRNEPFIAVNCAAIPQTLIEAELFGYEKGAFTGAYQNKKGKFELAHGGTIFLDEIADMSFEAQSKVLRAIEEMQFERIGGVKPIKIDVRIIAATNKEIEKEVDEGRFRKDLYYRLNVVPIHIPPLRERRGDIPALLEYYLDYFAKINNKKRKQLDKDAIKFLQESYNWPGNIRELKNLIERLNILIKDSSITLEDVRANLPFHGDEEYVTTGVALKVAKDKFEKNYILSTLKLTDYNITKAAKLLNVERSYLYKIMKRLGINSDTLPKR